jgi:hypothetical protein
MTRLLGLADWPGAFPQIAHAEFWNLQQALASSPEPFAMSCQLNLQCDAAILLQSDRIGANVSAIAAEILSVRRSNERS